MISAEVAFRTYHLCPNIFIPEVLVVIQEADALVRTATPSSSPTVRVAAEWLRRYRLACEPSVPLSPELVHHALIRAVLDVAEELFRERGLPFSAHHPCFIFTGRIADQSGIARRTLQELLAAANVPKVLHPEDGEAWLLPAAEEALALAGWVWSENRKPKRNPKLGPTEPIRLQGGRHHQRSDQIKTGTTCVSLEKKLRERWPRVLLHTRILLSGIAHECVELIFSPFSSRETWVAKQPLARSLEDLVAKGLLCPPMNKNTYWTTEWGLHRWARCNPRGSELAVDWQDRITRFSERPKLDSKSPKPSVFVSKGENSRLRREKSAKSLDNTLGRFI